jgi:hypothetical protein
VRFFSRVGAGVKLLVVSGAAVLAGCAANPYVKVPTTASAPSAGLCTDHLIAAVRDSFQSRLDGQSRLNYTTSLLTYVGFAGAAGAGLFDGSRDLILGTLTLGATSATIQNLYGSKAYVSIYSSGIDAVECVDAAVQPLMGRLQTLKKQSDLLDASVSRAKQRQAEVTAEQFAPLRERFNASIGAAAVASDAARLALLQDQHLCGQVRGALTKITSQVGDQIQLIRPDAEAIRNAAAGIGNQVKSAASQIQALEQPILIRGIGGDAQLKGFLDALDEVTHAVVTSVNSLEESAATPSFSCAVQALPVSPPITVDAPTPVEFKFGQEQTFRIAGGVPPYQVNWVGVAPDSVAWQLEYPSILRLKTKEGTTAETFKVGQAGALNIYDNTPGMPRHLQQHIIINTVK